MAQLTPTFQQWGVPQHYKEQLHRRVSHPAHTTSKQQRRQGPDFPRHKSFVPTCVIYQQQLLGAVSARKQLVAIMCSSTWPDVCTEGKSLNHVLPVENWHQGEALLQYVYGELRKRWEQEAGQRFPPHEMLRKQGR